MTFLLLSFFFSFFHIICFFFHMLDLILPNLVRSMYGWMAKTNYGSKNSPGSPGTSWVKNVKQCSMTTKIGQKNRWCKLNIKMTFIEVKGHQRSTLVNYVLWLPDLVRRIPDVSLWWWPSWKSKVIRGQMWKAMCYGSQTWSEESLMQVYDGDDLHGCQISNVIRGQMW